MRDKHEEAQLAPDQRIARLARRWKGVVTIAMLASIGISEDAARRRVRSGRMERIFAGVFYVGAGPVPTRSRWLAGVLAAGAGAVLSHESAASLWGLVRELVWPVHVTVPAPGNRRSRPGLKVHRSRTLTADEVTVVDGIPVTTPLRTIADLRAHLRDRAATEAVIRRLVDPSQLARPSRSASERRFRRRLEEAGITGWEHNAVVEGLECDFVFAAERLVVEVDGPHHQIEPQRTVDRLRDARLQLAGFTVLRVDPDAPGPAVTLIDSVLEQLRARP